MSKARSLADLLGGGAAGVAAFSGNGAIDVPAGTTAERPGNPNSGYVRFNTTEASLEQYDGTNWIIMPKPPIVSTLTYPNSQTAVGLDGGEVVTISGVNFETGVNVKFGTTYATSVSRTNSTSLNVTVPALTAGDYDVIVEQTDGTQAILTNGLSVNAAPVFTTSAGSLGSLQNGVAMSTITVVATEDDSGTITYAVTTGSLPTGTSLSGADISGTPTGYSAETTANFTITATDDEGQTTSRAFSLTVFVDFYNYTIDQSLRFNDDDTPRLTKTFSSEGTRTTWTWSGWVKPSIASTSEHWLHSVSSQSQIDGIVLYDADYSTWQIKFMVRSGYGGFIRTNQVFRDPSAWYHIVCVYDSTNATSGDRMRIYINGERITDFHSETQPSLNDVSSTNLSTDVGGDVIHYIGCRSNRTSAWDGYLAELNFIDGQALTPSYFGETKEGVWIPKAYSGTYGTNGFYLDFSNSSSIGSDASGNSNSWTPTNLATTDVVLDSPTNNFAQVSSVAWADTSSATMSKGNTRWVTNTEDDNKNFSSFKPTSGKWYYEIELEHTDESGWNYLYLVPSPGSYYWIRYSGQDQIYGSEGTLSISQPSDGSILQIAIDVDAGKTWYGLNNTWYTVSGTPDPAAGTGAANIGYANYEFDLALQGRGTGSSAQKLNINFGQDSSFGGRKTAQGNTDSNDIGDFYYEPPSGFLAMCNENLPDDATFELDTGEKPSDYFNIVTYTGDGTTSRSITGVGFQPDFVWAKERSGSGAHHVLVDSVRGLNTGGRLSSNRTNVEDNLSNATLDSFDSDGFTTGSSTNIFNANSIDYVAWCWKAGGTPVSNTDGSITSSVSANTTSGFSIVSYTGTGSAATVGHGLNKKPDLTIFKDRDVATAWIVEGEVIGSSNPDGLRLSSTEAKQSESGNYNNAGASVLNFPNGWAGVNNSSSRYIAYCFHSVDGFSKVGAYSGNSSTDGRFVYTGFKPAFVLFKNTTTAGSSWGMKDTVRDSTNPNNGYLFAESDNPEGTATSLDIDFLSNGFKFRGTSGDGNSSSNVYIYLAFAENPLKYGNAK